LKSERFIKTLIPFNRHVKRKSENLVPQGEEPEGEVAGPSRIKGKTHPGTTQIWQGSII